MELSRKAVVVGLASILSLVVLIAVVRVVRGGEAEKTSTVSSKVGPAVTVPGMPKAQKAKPVVQAPQPKPAAHPESKPAKPAHQEPAVKTVFYKLKWKAKGPGTVKVTVPSKAGQYRAGTKLRLTAVPNQAATFYGWYGSCHGRKAVCELTMGHNKAANAVFKPKSAPVVVTAAPVYRTPAPTYTQPTPVYQAPVHVTPAPTPQPAKPVVSAKPVVQAPKSVSNPETKPAKVAHQEPVVKAPVVEKPVKVSAPKPDPPPTSSKSSSSKAVPVEPRPDPPATTTEELVGLPPPP